MWGETPETSWRRRQRQNNDDKITSKSLLLAKHFTQSFKTQSKNQQTRKHSRKIPGGLSWSSKLKWNRTCDAPSSDRSLTMRMPKCVRWSHRQTVLLLLESSDARQPSLFQPPAPSGGGTEELLHMTTGSVQRRVRVKHGDMSDLVSTSIILHHHTDKTLFQSLITTTSSLKIKPGPVQDPSRTGPGSSNFYVSGLTYSPYFQLLRATLETILILYEQIRTDLDQDLKGTWTEPSWTSDDSCRTLNTVWNTRCLFSSLMWRLVWMYMCDK